MEISLDQWNEVINAIDTYYTDEYSVRTDYSGRGMYGVKCVGFVCERPYDLIFIIEKHFPQDHFINSNYFSMDNMGLQYIVYWPHVSLVSGEQTSDDSI